MLKFILMKDVKKMFLLKLGFLAFLYFLYLISQNSLLSIFIIGIVFYLLPGFFFLTRFSKIKFGVIDGIIFSFCIGIAFVTIIAYFSLLLHFKILNFNFWFILSFFLFLFSDFKKIEWKIENLKEYSLLFLIALINFLIFIYPSKELVKKAFSEIGYIPPGDDSKLHILLIKGILKHGFVPNKYFLYEKVPLVYPQGFHINVALLQSLSKIDLLPLTFFFGIFLGVFYAFSLYLFGKYFFDKKIGIILAFGSLADIAILRFITYGIYANLFGYFIFPVFILSLYFSIKKKISYFIPTIFLSFFINTTLFSSFIGFMLLLFLVFRFRNFLKIILLSLLFSSPFILNLFNILFKFYLGEAKFGNILLKASSLVCFPFPFGTYFRIFMLFLNPQFLVVGIFGLLLLKKDRKFLFVGWLWSCFLLFMIKKFLWMFSNFIYWLREERILMHLSLPLTILSFYFIFQTWQNDRKKLILSLFLLLILPVYLKIFRLPEITYQIPLKEDLMYINWIKENIPKNEILFNDFYKGTTTTLIPPLAERKVTFPFGFFAPLNIKFKSPFIQYSLIVRKIPDSSFAIKILKTYYNASYVTFSSGFKNIFGSYVLPQFEVEKFTEPCYKKVYEKYGNYIFKINYENCSGENYIIIEKIFIEDKIKNVSLTHILKNVKISPVFASEVESFLMIFASPNFLGINKVRCRENNETIGEIVITSVGKDIPYLLELPKNFLMKGCSELVFDKEIYISSIYLFVRHNKVKKIGESIYLLGDLEEKDKKLIINLTHFPILLLKNVEEGDRLIIEFNDSNGNVDFNYYENGWKSFYILYRNGTLKRKKLEIRINFSSKLLTLSIVPHESNFEIYKIEIKSNREKLFKKIINNFLKIDLSNISLFKPVFLGNWMFKENSMLIPPKDTSIKLIAPLNVKEVEICIISLYEKNIDVNIFNFYLKKWKGLFVFTKESEKCKKFENKKFKEEPLVIGIYNHNKNPVEVRLFFY